MDRALVSGGSWSKIAIAALGLIFLELFLSNHAAAANVGGAETGAANLLQKFLDPAVPAFSSSSSSTSTTSTSTGPQGSGPGGTGPAGPVAPDGTTTSYQPSTTPPADYELEYA